MAKAARRAPKRKYRVPVNVQKFGFWLEPATVDRWRDAVDFLSGPPERLTLSRLVSLAVDREVARLARKYNEGQAFPKRAGELRRGSRPRA